MHAITRLNDAIKFSRRRTQAVQLQSVEKSEPQTTAQAEKIKKPKAEHINTKLRQYIDSGCIRLKPR